MKLVLRRRALAALMTSWQLGLGAVLLSNVSSCARSAAPRVPGAPPAQARPVVHYCSATVTYWDEHRCLKELTPFERARRAQSHRLTVENGHLATFETLNGSGHFAPGEKRCVKTRFKYSGSRLIGASCQDQFGRPFSELKVSQDRRWARWLDAHGRPRRRAGDNVSGLLRSFDATGRITGYRFVDERGQPTPNQHGVYEFRFRRNAAGSLEETSYWGKNGEPVLGDDGAHKLNVVFGPFEDWLEARYFGVHGEPILNKQGAHRVSYRSNAVGETIFSEAFGLRDEPVRFSAGHHASANERDSRGNVVETRFFGLNGELVITKDGHAILRTRYDAKGRPIEESHFGPDDKLIATKKRNYARVLTEYDARGRGVIKRFVDARDQPLQGSPETHSGYDDHNNVSWEAYYANDGKPVGEGYECAGKVMRYDEFDQLVETQCVGGDGYWRLPRKGYAIERIERDASGREQGRRYFAADLNEVHMIDFSMVVIPFRSETPRPVEASAALESNPATQVTRSKAEARKLLQKVLELARSKKSLDAAASSLVLRAYLEHYSGRARESLHESARALAPGEFTEIVENEDALWVLQRDPEKQPEAPASTSAPPAPP